MSLPRVLFVCSGNTCRSPMSAALAASLEPGLKASSAGISAVPDQCASEGALESMRERGLDLSAHRSRRLDARLVEEADLILVMTSDHRRAFEKLFPSAMKRLALLTEYARLGARALGSPDGEDVTDPFGCEQSVYDACAEELELALRAARAHWSEMPVG
ncbi:low molecular weight protein arginine phosphatase [bacterium CPR1]|nr:low molecular weight protein arginine phosphatase [bacterium CPR1]